MCGIVHCSSNVSKVRFAIPLLLSGDCRPGYTARMGILFFFAVPSWIVGIALSSRFRPVISFVGVMFTFVATVKAAHIFSMRQLFTSVDGVGVLLAEAVAALILIRAIVPPSRNAV